MRSILIYYSRSGNTKNLADKIAQELNCEKIRITPEKEYGNYVSACIRAAKEQSASNKPVFINDIPNLSEYDAVLVGYSIWMSKPPVIVSEFMSKCDFNGKAIIPFSTSDGTHISKTLPKLDSVCAGARIIMPYNYGMIKKDNFESWISLVKKYMEK